MKKSCLKLLIMIAFLLLNTAFVKANELETTENYAADEVLVVYKENISIKQEAKIARSYGLTIASSEEVLSDVTGNIQEFDTVHLFEIDDNTPVLEVVEKLNADPSVKYAEPNYIMQLYDSVQRPNDSYLKDQWYLEVIDAYGAWEALDPISELSPVKVGVLDSQVQLNHPDLIANVSGAYNVLDESDAPAAGTYHGTHVAGIIAATANNGRAIAGITNNTTKIVPVNIGTGTLFTSDVIKGYQYAAAQGVRVMNMSFGSYADSKILEQTLKQGHRMGIVNVASAGNDHVAWAHYPSDYDCVIGVIATTDSNAKASFSNYGPRKNISAPGVNIISTVPTNTCAYMSGTSMAAPIVSGTAALILAVNPELSAFEVEEILYATAIDLGDEGFDRNFGSGLIDADAAVTYAKDGSIEVTDISLDQEAQRVVLDIGKTKALTLNYLPINATNKNEVKWASKDPNIAKISTAGIITALKSGTTTVTASLGALHTSCEVTVTDELLTPADLNCKSYHYDTIRVSWSEIKAASGYEIFRADRYNGSFLFIGETTSPVYYDTPVEAGKEYYYKIRAYVDADDKRIYSALSEWMWGYAQVATPTNLLVSEVQGKIQVSWKAAGGAVGYELERAVDGGSYEALATITSGDTVCYIDDTAENGKVYSYRLCAYCNATTQSRRKSAYVTTADYSLGGAIEMPITVETVTATVLDHQRVRIAWSAGTGAKGYEIYRSTKKGDTALMIADINEPETLSYEDEELTVGVAYYYFIRPYKIVDGIKEYSIDSTTVSVTPLYQSIPGNVSAKALSTSSVLVTWDAVDGVKDYVVNKMIPTSVNEYGIRYTVSKVIVHDSLEYLHTDLDTEKEYAYTVSVLNGKESEWISVTPRNITYAALERISFNTDTLTIHAGSKHSLDISYQPVNAYIATADWNSEDEMIASVDENGVITGISSGTTEISCTVSGKTAICEVTVSEPMIKAPSGIRAIANGFDQVILSWDAVDSADGYYVYRRIGTRYDTAYEKLSKNTLTSTCAVAYDTNTYFKVQAYKIVDGYEVLSDAVAEVSCRATGSAPENLRTICKNDGLLLNWQPVSGADGYVVLRSTKADRGFRSVATISGNDCCAYLDAGTDLTGDTIYYYKVKAYLSAAVLDQAYKNQKLYGALSECCYETWAAPVPESETSQTETSKPQPKPVSPPSPVPTKKPAKKGTIAKVGDYYYKVTKSGAVNGTVTLVKPMKKTLKKVIVPATVSIDGYRFSVTAIRAKAFKNNKKLKKVTIGKYVSTIEKQAFSGCTKLKQITIKSDRLKKVGKSAFKKVPKKVVVKVPQKNRKAYEKLLKKAGIPNTANYKKG